MSLNISSKYLKVSTNIEMTVDLTLLGPRQRSTFRRVLNSGVTFNASYAPSASVLCATQLRRNAGLPVFECGTRRVAWYNVRDNDDFFNRLTASAVARKLSREALTKWEEQYLQRLLDDAQGKVETQHPFYTGVSVASMRQVFKGFTFCPYPHEVRETIVLDITKGL